MLFKGNVLERMIPSGKLQLGWLVRDRERPLSSCHKVPNPPKGERVAEVKNFQETISKDTKLTLGAFLSQLLSLSFAPSTGVSMEVTADVSAIDILPDDEADAWYKSLCRKSSTRSWIQDRISDGDQARLIVGIHTLKNAKVAVTEQKGKGIGATFTLPLGAMLGLPGILDTAIDPGLSALREVERKASQGFEADDLIYAVAYKKIRVGFLCSKNVDKTILDHTNWKFSLKRGAVKGGKEDENQVDMIETRLEDDDSDSNLDDDGITFSLADGNQLQLTQGRESSDSFRSMNCLPADLPDA